jgi:hypothetical protein
MAILDLQGMQTPSDVRYGKSGASKHCGGGGGASFLSLLLC